MNKEIEKIQNMINNYKKRNPESSVDELSDSYHSFNDLYKHRTYLLAIAMIHIPYAWKAKVHEDGTMYDGMFVTGFPTPTGMISYHCDMEYWNLFKVPSLPKAPHFDGYTDKDVLGRIYDYISSSSSRLVNGDNIDKIEKIVVDEILPTFGEDPIGKATFIGFYNR